MLLSETKIHIMITKNSNKTAGILMAIGIVLIVLSLGISNFAKISDLVSGLLIGVGIGLLILSLKLRRQNSNTI